MGKSTALADFVERALVAGNSKPEIREALAKAGWMSDEIGKALDAYADFKFPLPVPKPTVHLTAREAFFYATLFVALAMTAYHLVSLLHGIVDNFIPPIGNAARHSAAIATRKINWAIAILAISTPVYAWLSILGGRQAARDSAQRRSPIRKWVTYFVLFLAALAFLSTGAYTIYQFLSGDFTARFALKSLVVAAVSAAVFGFHLAAAEENAGA